MCIYKPYLMMMMMMLIIIINIKAVLTCRHISNKNDFLSSAWLLVSDTPVYLVLFVFLKKHKCFFNATMLNETELQFKNVPR